MKYLICIMIIFCCEFCFTLIYYMNHTTTSTTPTPPTPPPPPTCFSPPPPPPSNQPLIQIVNDMSSAAGLKCSVDATLYHALQRNKQGFYIISLSFLLLMSITILCLTLPLFQHHFVPTLPPLHDSFEPFFQMPPAV